MQHMMVCYVMHLTPTATLSFGSDRAAHSVSLTLQ
jgi:hypothetical protein